MEKICDDVLLYALFFVPSKDLPKFRILNKYFNDLMESNDYVWKLLLIQRNPTIWNKESELPKVFSNWVDCFLNCTGSSLIEKDSFVFRIARGSFIEFATRQHHIHIRDSWRGRWTYRPFFEINRLELSFKNIGKDDLLLTLGQGKHNLRGVVVILDKILKLDKGNTMSFHKFFKSTDLLFEEKGFDWHNTKLTFPPGSSATVHANGSCGEGETLRSYLANPETKGKLRFFVDVGNNGNGYVRSNGIIVGSGSGAPSGRGFGVSATQGLNIGKELGAYFSKLEEDRKKKLTGN